MKTLLISLLMVLASPCLLVAQNTSNTPLEGTWKLVKTKWGDMEGFKKPEREIYKIFTQNHYFFVYYDKEKFYGAGGGTYTSDDQTFTENIAYFSWDSTAVGTQQTFNWTITDNQLYQSGRIDNTDKYDGYVIEEYYERVEPAPDRKVAPLTGVWRMKKSTYGESTMTSEESTLKIQKIFTPKYWYAVYTDKQTGKFSGLGFGTYELKGDQYYETIDAYSWDQTAVGQTVQFTMTIEPDALKQSGVLNTDKYKDYKIVEEMVRVEQKSNAKEETALAAILQVIETETKCFYARDYDCWKAQWINEEYAAQTWSNSDGTFTTSNGWATLNTKAQQFIKNYPVPKGGSSHPLVKRENMKVRFLGENGAYLYWTQYNSNQEKTKYTISHDVRVMEKVNGQWKIVNVSSFWDYKNLVDVSEMKE